MEGEAFRLKKNLILIILNLILIFTFTYEAKK